MKTLISNRAALTILVGMLAIIALTLFTISSPPAYRADAAGIPNVPYARNASSTAITVGTSTSVQLLATTTGATGQRIGALIQPINCPAGANLFMMAEDGAAAVANTGFYVTASSTLQFGAFPELPVPQNTVNGITTVGTCTVLVTEFLANK